MGCLGDFFRKMKKTVWRGQFDPPPPGKGGVKLSKPVCIYFPFLPQKIKS